MWATQPNFLSFCILPILLYMCDEMLDIYMNVDVVTSSIGMCVHVYVLMFVCRCVSVCVYIMIAYVTSLIGMQICTYGLYVDMWLMYVIIFS